MTDDRPIELERFESALWQTASLLVCDGDEAVLVDPCISREEVARIAARVEELGVRVTHVLATHGDWDHVCGIAAFPDAVAAMGPLTADRIRSGQASRELADAAAQYDLEFPGEPRVDAALAPGETHELAPVAVEVIALPGHTADGVGYLFRTASVLAVGDHLSTVEFPFASDTAAYRATLRAILDLLHGAPPALVVPGHGPALDTASAITVAEADLGYLEALRDAVAAGGREAGLRVSPPRAAPDDLARELEANVDAQLRELQGSIAMDSG